MDVFKAMRIINGHASFIHGQLTRQKALKRDAVDQRAQNPDISTQDFLAPTHY